VIASLVLAYIGTGIALTGYDFSADPIDQKQYVIQRNFKVAMIMWFVWPISAVSDFIALRHFKRRSGRFALGVLLLLAAMYMWARLFYLIGALVFHSALLGLVIGGFGILFVAPFLTRLALPPYDEINQSQLRK
jgi:hypothetical protein